MGHRTDKQDQPSSAEGVTALVSSLDLGAHSGMFGAHACVGDVLVTVVVPGHGQFDSRWCLACLEDSDPLDGLHRLVPGTSVSVRAGA